ncbi:MAG: 6-bladed beta-propeller, partial [Candidatus Thorarchaeota archaeon]
MKHTLPKLAALVFAVLILTSMLPMGLPDIPTSTDVDGIDTEEILNNMLLNGTDFNLTNDYRKIWEPNNIRGSTHAVATTEDGEYMATAGGYLNDREVHIYRWWEDLKQYWPIWDAGDTEIMSDVMDVDFMDADNDNRLEVVAGSQDGRIYVFEQVGEQDEPFGVLSSAHIWELVWDSGRVLDRQVWSVMAYDIDHDSHDEIIAGVWDDKVHVFDFVDAEAYPYCLDDNWFIFEHVWDSGDAISGRVNDIAVVDSDNDTHYEIVAGSQDHKVYLFESCDCFIHEYELIWDSGDTIYAPINSVAASQDLDDDKFGEIVVSAYGLGVYIFEFTGEDYEVRKINRDIMSWEKGISETTGVYTGYEADIWGDRKVYGWEDQGIYEYDPIPPPYDTEYLGGASALGGPWDDSETTFASTEQFQFMTIWNFESGNEAGQFNVPYDIALAPDGTFYITDFLNHRVVRVNENMEFLMMWGENGNETGQFDSPTGITVDEDGFVYVADLYNSRIQKFNRNGVFIASWGSNGSLPGQFYGPFDVAVREGMLYVSDYANNRIQVLDAETGEFLFTWGTPGSGVGQFDLPSGIAIDSEGNVYVGDVNNDRVQKFTYDGVFINQWGTFGTGPGDFDSPGYLAIDHDDRVYVTDTGNERVQKFSPSGDYESEFGSTGSNPGEFTAPIGIALHPIGGIIVVDALLNNVQRFGVQEYELVDVFDIHEDILQPVDLAFDSEGNYYVTGVFTPSVYKYAPDGTFLLNWSLSPTSWALGIEVDQFDNVYVTDVNNHIVYVYDTMGNETGTIGTAGTGDGELNGPVDLAFDMDYIYVSEFYNSRISVFDWSYQFIRHIGAPGAGLGLLNSPHGIEIGPDGLLYISDRYNYRIQRFYPNGTAIDTWSVPDEGVYLAFDSEGNLYLTGGTFDTIKKYAPTGTLVDVYDEKSANYFDQLGQFASWGIEYRPENASFYITDATNNKVAMLRPYLALNNASVAVIDYGQWEEITGDATDLADFYIAAETSLETENIEFAISQDLETFKTIDSMDYNFYFEGILGPFGFIAILGVDVDNALRDAVWDDFRYLRISVKGGVTYDIDATWGRVNRPIATALTVRIGDIKLTPTSDGTEEIIIGTVDGEILAVTSMGVEVWASQSDQPRFSLQTQIWDIVQVTGKGRFPTWLFNDNLIQDSDIIGSIPSFDHFVTYDMVNIDYDSALDMVATVREGAYTRLIYLRNTGTDESPVFNYVPNYFVTQTTLLSDQILSYASVTMGDLDGDYDDDLMLGTAWLDVDLGWVYELRYFEQTAVDFWTEQPGYLSDIGTYVIGNGFMPRV